MLLIMRQVEARSVARHATDNEAEAEAEAVLSQPWC